MRNTEQLKNCRAMIVTTLEPVRHNGGKSLLPKLRIIMLPAELKVA
jgi:hypothetical protein